jgi:hypothetical protein
MVDKLVGRMELTRHLVGNNELIPRLLEKGIIEQRPDGQFDRDECRERYIRHLRARPPRGTGNAKLLDVRTRLAELRLSERAHELIPRAEFNDAWKILWGIVVSKLSAVAPRCTRDAALRDTIEREIGRARNEACDEFEKQAEALERAGEAAPVR